MTENNASVRLEVIRAGLLSGTDARIVSNEENIKTITVIINALEEIRQYRAIGTPKECRKAMTVRREAQEIINQQLIAGERQLRRDICLLSGSSKSSSDELLDKS